MNTVGNPKHIENILNETQTLKENSIKLVNSILKHTRNVINSDADLSHKIAQEVEFVTSLDAVTLKDNAGKIGEPISNIISQITNSIEESDNPIIQNTLPIVKQHTKNPQKICEDIKEVVENSIDKVFEQGSEVQNEVIKTVVKNKIQKKIFKNSIMNKLYEYYLKIKNFIIRNISKEN